METAPPGGAGMAGYADSIESLSPRSRGAESWDEPFAPSAAVAAAAAAANASKLRLMCSYGGQIVPRPHDRSLCYLGGETRIVVVDRHSTLADLHARLSRSLLGGNPFSLKYQLPSEDLDSLISVTTDEDLDNMIEEYDRIAAASSSSSGGCGGGGGKPARLRLFLFPAQPESGAQSTSSMGSLLDDSKSETWFVDALNSAMLGRGHASADSASSVNCLLGLDDSKPSPNGAGAGAEDSGGVPPESDNEMGFPRRDSSGKLGGGSRHGGHSAPDSPMLGTMSSFGSASSAPSLSNLPPIRVRPDADRGSNPKPTGAALEEHFGQMNISDQQQQQQQQQQQFDPHLQYYNHPPPHPIPTRPNVSPAEEHKPGRIFSSDDDRSDHGDIQRSSAQRPQQQYPQPPPAQQQQKPPNVYDLPLPGDGATSRPMYYQEVPPPTSDPRLVADRGYLLQQQQQQPPPPMQAADMLAQQQQQAQQQFVQVNPHLVHHHPYYQIPIHPQQQLPQAAHPYNPQMPMYSMPLRPSPTYSLPMQPQPTLVDVTASAQIPSATKPTAPLPNTMSPSAVAPPSKPELATSNIYPTGVGIRPAAPAAAQPLQSPQLIHMAEQPHQYVGYHSMHQPRPHSAAAVPPPGYGYEYADIVRPQQVYYTQVQSASLPPQYQVLSSGAVMAEVPPSLQQTTDGKQTRPS